METCFNLFLCSSLEMRVFSSLRTTQLMTYDHYPEKDWLSFNMRSAGRFYLMVNQTLISAGDRIGFQKNMENCPSKKQLFFHLHSACEADIW